MRAMLRSFGLAGILLSLATPALATWQKELTRQMKEDVGCEVTFITQVIERDTAAGKFIQAHVGCADQRNFTVSRDGALKRFAIEPCEKKVLAC